MKNSSITLTVNDIPILYSPEEERKINVQIELETLSNTDNTNILSTINQIIFDTLNKRNPATLLYYIDEQMLMFLLYDAIYSKFSNKDYTIIITYNINDTSTVSIKTQHKPTR